MIHELEETFVKGSRTYRQVAKTDAGCIYQIDGDDNFEVLKRIIKPKPIFDENGFVGHSDEFMVVYPSEAKWGEWAWTFIHIESAMKKLNEISKIKV